MTLHQIIPRRFGLKNSPRPMIALEFERVEPDAGKSILEVAIDRLTPKTHDADGVVAALQFTHPRFLGPDVVSMNQLKRLVSRLLAQSRENLPPEYAAVMNSSTASGPLTTVHSKIAKPADLPSLQEGVSLPTDSGSTVSTPTLTPEAQRPPQSPSSSTGTEGTRNDTDGNGQDMSKQECGDCDTVQSLSPQRDGDVQEQSVEDAEDSTCMHDPSSLENPRVTTGAEAGARAWSHTTDPAHNPPAIIQRESSSQQEDRDGDEGDQDEDDIPESIEDENAEDEGSEHEDDEDEGGEGVLASSICMTVKEHNEKWAGQEISPVPIEGETTRQLSRHTPTESFGVENTIPSSTASDQMSHPQPGAIHGAEAKVDNVRAKGDPVDSSEEDEVTNRKQVMMPKPPPNSQSPQSSGLLDSPISRPPPRTHTLEGSSTPTISGEASTPSLSELPLPPLSGLRSRGGLLGALPPVNEIRFVSPDGKGRGQIPGYKPMPDGTLSSEAKTTARTDLGTTENRDPTEGNKTSGEQSSADNCTRVHLGRGDDSSDGNNGSRSENISVLEDNGESVTVKVKSELGGDEDSIGGGNSDDGDRMLSPLESLKHHQAPEAIGAAGKRSPSTSEVREDKRDRELLGDGTIDSAMTKNDSDGRADGKSIADELVDLGEVDELLGMDSEDEEMSFEQDSDHVSGGAEDGREDDYF